SAASTPLLWLKAPIRVAKWMANPVYRVRRQRRIRHAIEENLRFDYGATGSVRESGSDKEYAKYFQKMDIERFHKIIDRHLLTSIRQFLKGRSVDTSELERSMRFIINQVWIGAFSGVNLTVGTGAEINLSVNGAGPLPYGRWT